MEKQTYDHFHTINIYKRLLNHGIFIFSEFVSFCVTSEILLILLTGNNTYILPQGILNVRTSLKLFVQVCIFFQGQINHDRVRNVLSFVHVVLTQ